MGGAGSAPLEVPGREDHSSNTSNTSNNSNSNSNSNSLKAQGTEEASDLAQLYINI